MGTSSLFFESALLPQGWARGVRLGIEDGRIARIDLGQRSEPGDERAGIGLPGLGNLHSHAFQRALAGLAEFRGGSDDFWSWRDVMYRFLERLSPDDVEAISAMAFCEMLEGGFTRVGEFHYLHNDPLGMPYDNRAEMAYRIGAAAEQAGIGLTLLPVFYERGGFDDRPPNPAQKRFSMDVDAFALLREQSGRAIRPLAGAALGLAPHSLRAVSPSSLEALLSAFPTGPIHIHVAEQQREVDECVATLGAPPVRWLMAHAPVGAGWCLIHATHAGQDEIAALAASGAVVGLCPLSEANLGDGIFPLRFFLSKKGRFGVGSDSNILVSAIEELRMLEYGQRLSCESRNIAATEACPSTARTLFDGALQGGAEALNGAKGLVAGGPADIIALKPGDEIFAGREGDQILDSLIFCGRPSAIAGVWRGGMKLVHGGRHVRRDEIVRRYKQTLARLLAR